MNYYNEIKKELINNEVYKKVKDYSKNRNDLSTYYEVGKLLIEAGKQYGQSIVKKYAIKLTEELGKQYNYKTLLKMRKFYLLNQKFATVSRHLTWSHYVELLKFDNINIIRYYIEISIKYNLTVRQLREKIKNQEYERLSDKTKEKLEQGSKEEVQDFIKNPIVIRNVGKDIKLSEKLLQSLIVEDITHFMEELGEGFCYIKNEYKIKIGDRYNYIDLLLFNIKYNCYVVVELKVTELKKEHIGQITTYMHYIDKNIRSINQERTIGIIIVRKDNHFIMQYCSDERLYRTTYQLT